MQTRTSTRKTEYLTSHIEAMQILQETISSNHIQKKIFFNYFDKNIIRKKITQDNLPFQEKDGKAKKKKEVGGSTGIPIW